MSRVRQSSRYRPWEDNSRDERYFRSAIEPVEDHEPSEYVEGGWQPTRFAEPIQRVVKFCRTVIGLQPVCESPIEVQLGAHLSNCLDRAGIQDVELIPQYVWRRYRFDFAITHPGPRGLVFIECDGKEFHSTDEQLERDRKKDAEARDAGYEVFRFSGSDIYRQGEQCAQVVVAEVIQRLRRFS